MKTYDVTIYGSSQLINNMSAYYRQNIVSISESNWGFIGWAESQGVSFYESSQEPKTVQLSFKDKEIFIELSLKYL